MATKKRSQIVLLMVLGIACQAPAVAAPFDVFWQKCRASNTQAALDACDRAHDLRPLDAAVQKRGDDLFLLLEKQKKSGTPVPQPYRPPPQPAQPRQPAPDPFDTHWKKCRAANTQAALNSCKLALNLRSSNATVRKRINDLTLLLKPPPSPRPPVVVQQRPELPSAPIDDKPKVDKEVISQNQKILTQLGFDTGGTKGTIGKKTRKAIEDFTQVSGITISSKLNDEDLVKLEAAMKRHEEAMDKYEVAKKEREEGELSLALNTVEEAIEVAPWNNSLHSLEEELKQEEKQKADEADEIIQELDEDFKDLESLD